MTHIKRHVRFVDGPRDGTEAEIEWWPTIRVPAFPTDKRVHTFETHVYTWDYNSDSAIYQGIQKKGSTGIRRGTQPRA
jgi:hypothetical protein